VPRAAWRRVPLSKPGDDQVVAGEASGDALAATLIHAVRHRLPHARFVGVAGPRMEAAGCEAWYPLEMLAVRGLVEVLSRLPQLFELRRALFRRFVAERVPVFVGVDAPDFNLGLERKLKRAGVRSLHLVSPSVGLASRTAAAVGARSIGCPRQAPRAAFTRRPEPVTSSAIRSRPKRRSLRREARDQLKLGAAGRVRVAARQQIVGLEMQRLRTAGGRALS
jgi:hypothetical protein